MIEMIKIKMDNKSIAYFLDLIVWHQFYKSVIGMIDFGRLSTPSMQNKQGGNACVYGTVLVSTEQRKPADVLTMSCG